MAEKSRKSHSDLQIVIFTIILCFSCGLILALVAFALHKPQEEAKEFDRSKQMLIAAKILSSDDYLELLQEDGTVTRARYDEKTSTLIADPEAPKAHDEQIRAIAEERIRPLLTNVKGEVTTLEEHDINLPEYLSNNQKTGYANLPLKLFYAILPNETTSRDITAEQIAEDLTLAQTFVIPVSGFGLWGPIYGYLAIAPNGDEVIGTTWYELAETPGLGANIANPGWQSQFFGKLIFEAPTTGETDFETATIGIIVVKGKVSDVYGITKKAQSAVDGISGATITGDGVTAAYKNSLTPYRAFLIKLHTTSGGKE